ncbi:NAD-dependent epimerase/dehydratase family protein [Celeribacter litoreus]|uniref:NAD-dependent epimerase/dehydratase family protein n=1 Tax=Celeribacter litoreus TaxID=2876714 RepID=UPI001CCDD91B|nr:NAD(P)-dependent oxidoreductase [Celeribacter litoreus]MCA0044883.1 NAD(P)-dependent oxidoreductase [Celeribacter litoreus]
MTGWTEKPVLVTGGTGFLGAFVARELVAQGLKPRLFDLRPQAETLEFVSAGLSDQCEIIAGDVTDAPAVADAMLGCGAVIHLAGLMTIDCKADPVRAAKVNLIGGQTVIAEAVNARASRLAYASSSAVYGAGEGRLPHPETLYGVHKLAIEGMARCAWLDHGLPSVGFRPYIVYGPGESAGIAAGPSIALRAAALAQSATIQFSGAVGFVHVADVARAFVQGLFEATEGAEVFDLHGASATVEEFVRALKDAVPDARVEIEGNPLKTPEILQGGARAAWFDALPVTSLEDGISQTLAHWRAALQDA